MLLDAIVADNALVNRLPVGAEANIKKRNCKTRCFFKKPKLPPRTGETYSSALGYNMYLAGNISSALVNLTQLPLVTYPKLIAEFGVGPATNMMFKLLKQYFKNLASPSIGRDDNTTLTVPGTRRFFS